MFASSQSFRLFICWCTSFSIAWVSTYTRRTARWTRVSRTSFCFLWLWCYVYYWYFQTKMCSFLLQYILGHFNTKNHAWIFDIVKKSIWTLSIFLVCFFRTKCLIPRIKCVPGGQNVLIPSICIQLFFILGFKNVR